jgi:lipopolysaccharide export system ATP-binding protein
MTAVEPILVVDSVGRAYGGRPVLRSAYFQALPGRIHGLLGRNGAGKTTLLRIAAGLVAPDHGIVRFRGAHVERPSLARLARRGLFFWPVARPLLSPGMTVREHLRGWGEVWGREGQEAVIERLRLGDLLAKKGAALSGGEVQRWHLALALLRRPYCLLADEPFRGVSPADAELIIAALRELATDGAAIVLTGHEMGPVLDAIDDVTWVVSGTTRYLGPTVRAREDQEFRREYLGT